MQFVRARAVTDLLIADNWTVWGITEGNKAKSRPRRVFREIGIRK